MRDGATDDAERFRGVFDGHVDAIVRYARRRVDADAADDVVAEVFLVVWRRLQHVPADPLPWLYGVARRVVANHRRGVHRAAQLVDRIAAVAVIEKADWPLRADPGEAVPSSLRFAEQFNRLSEDDREVLALVAWEGLSARRTAAALGCSTGAVAMRLRRARSRLRSMMSDPEEGT